MANNDYPKPLHGLIRPPRGWPTVADITFDARFMNPDDTKITEIDVLLDLHTAGVITTQTVFEHLERTMALNLTPGAEEQRRMPHPPLSREEIDRQRGALQGSRNQLTLDLNRVRQLASIPPLLGTAADPLPDIVRTYIPRNNQQLAADAIRRAMNSGAASIELTPFLRPLPPQAPPAINTSTARMPVATQPTPLASAPSGPSLHRQRRLVREQ